MQVQRSISSDEEDDIVQESPRKILAAVQNKASPAHSWSSRHQSRATLMSPNGPNRQAISKTPAFSDTDWAVQLSVLLPAPYALTLRTQPGTASSELQ